MNSHRLGRSVCLALAALSLTAGRGPAPAHPVPSGAPQQRPAALPADPLLAVGADSTAILGDLEALAADAMEGRRSGTPGAVRARELIARRLRDAGLRPRVQSFSWESRRDSSTLEGANVVTRVAGSGGSSDLIVVTAHYDHVGVREGEVYNGADDNASGVAALLFLARYLTQHPLRHSVLLVALDAEELGLRGAQAFVDDPSTPLASVRLNVNLDMVARTNDVLWAAGPYHYPELRPVLEEVAGRAPLALRLGHDQPNVAGVDDWSRSSDHRVFHSAGIPFVYFGVEDHPDYHRATDDFERVKPQELLDAVRTITLALRELDGMLAGA